jgi:hypothetical protein
LRLCVFNVIAASKALNKQKHLPVQSIEVSVNTEPTSPSGCGSFAGKGFGTIFFGVFFLMGALFTVLIVGEAWKQMAPWWWPETDCTILSSSIGETGNDNSPYRAVVRYSYEVDGHLHESDRLFRSDEGTASFDTARDRAARYPAGASATCRVGSNHPALAVLERRFPWMVFVIFFPLIFVAIGGGGLWATWIGFKSKEEGAVQSISQSASTGRGHKFMIGFGLLFVAIGSAVFVPMTLLPSIRIAVSMTWEATPCTIVSTSMRSWSTDDGTSYRADVLYVYRAAGDARAVLDRHPEGSSTTCWIDPGNPNRSVLERQFRPKHLLGLIPLVFVIAGAAIANHGRKKLNSQRPPEGIAVEEDSGADRPVVLKPQVGPIGKVGGALFFALFWNGIVSVFVWQAWKGWERGEPDWFLTIFLIPFVLVGLASFGFVGHFLLALANPRLAHLRIFLEGSEEATYQRGTDTITEREVFSSFDLVNTGNDWEIPRGSTELTIPADTMHSFEATSNRIIWEIKVEGEVVRWPDVDQNFPIDIRPIQIEEV